MNDGVRLADLLAPMSLISDMGLGLPAEDAMRSCLLGTALARRLDLNETEVAEVFMDRFFSTSAALGMHTRPSITNLAAGSRTGRSKDRCSSTRRASPNTRLVDAAPRSWRKRMASCAGCLASL